MKKIKKQKLTKLQKYIRYYAKKYVSTVKKGRPKIIKEKVEKK